MELSDYLRILRAHWVGVVALAVVGVLGALAFNLTQAKVYAANASGFVSTGASSNPALGSVGDSLAKSRAQSYVAIAQSRAVAADVIANLGLDVQPGSLIGHISVTQPTNTVLLKVVAQDSSPRSAQQLANAWVTALAEEVAKIEDPNGKAGASGLRVVPLESAVLPSVPILPRVKLNLLIGLVLGLILGIAYALVRNQLDRRIRAASDVERVFHVPVIGAVPLTNGLAHKSGERAQIAVVSQGTNASRSEAEAFRKLRTNLAYMDVDNPPRVIVVTSPKEGDGKSTVAANVAAAIASAGRSVVLVDADLRRPTVADSFGLAEGVGLTDLLIGRIEVAEALQQVPEVANLSVLASGRVPPNPSELLGTQAMETLLRDLATNSLVIVDAPPLLPVTDAAVLTAVADGALVVISAGKTLDTELGAALGHLAAVNGRSLGVVFNRAIRSGDDTGYYSGAYYQARQKIYTS